MNEVKKTKNYEQFHIIKENRQLRPKHLEKLRKSIEGNDKLFANPILVDENHYVIDGQHRLTVAKELGVPVYYRVVPGLTHEDMLTFNTCSLKWSSEDVLHYYCEKGLDDYIRFKELIDKVSLPFSVMFALVLGNKHSKYKQFREGKFTFDFDIDEMNFEAYKDTLATLSLLKGNIGAFRSKRFSRAFFNFARREDFDEKHWLKNLSLLITRFQPCVSESEYIELIERTYYYRKRKQNYNQDEGDDED